MATTIPPQDMTQRAMSAPRDTDTSEIGPTERGMTNNSEGQAYPSTFPPDPESSSNKGSRRSEEAPGAVTHSTLEVDVEEAVGEKPIVLDIEHVPVEDDPREWSERKKTVVLVMVAFAALSPTLGASIYNPAFEQLREQLSATDTELSLSVSLFILFQGGWPIFWSSIAEVTGRKVIYLVSNAIFIVGTIVASRAQNMTVLIIMRLLQGFGSAAVLSVGAGSLADMYEKHERGTKMGVYYAVPLIGPALGSVIGGILTSASSWRATFYLLAAFGGVSFSSFIFFPDSWRRERSQLYQKATQRAIKRALEQDVHDEKKRIKKREKGLKSGDQTPANMTVPQTPTHGIAGSGIATPLTRDSYQGPERTAVQTPVPELADQRQVKVDLEQKEVVLEPRRRVWSALTPWGKKRSTAAVDNDEEEHVKVKLRLADVNPAPAMWHILKRPNNFLAVTCSGLIFAAQYTITFTAAVTFAAPPYDYTPLKIGLLLLSFGGGNVLGSILGGRYSDLVLRKLKKKNGGVGQPEMRLKSTVPAMPVMVASFLVYAWTSDQKTNVAGPIVALVFGGFSLMVIYASTLAYLVDANPGRSSSAIACNSFFRGTFAFVASQVALPIRNSIGDGGLYTIFSGLLALSCLGFWVVIANGQAWRDPAWRWPGFRGNDK
ncbi:hypothetical protein FFLO_02285 [Filobasidium floriforme]|uniref:Major facilitator superfamily (MFS) profile domain-containing protein n=1 Tax=Filobasidium floriforme TaxID=5210 RepID=A0A8K0JNM5_9TREE|nr:hypothetical protein FFLO_02285 [Filobasidium floriforme]